MNETLKVIYGRRSIRQYAEHQILDENLRAILDAALYAPNAMNMQTWHFTVIRDKSLLDRMVATIRENMLTTGIPRLLERAKDPDYHTFYHAPTVVMISGDSSARLIGIDCGAAAQTLALAAESMNIGSCLIASSALLFAADSAESYKKELGIPEGYDHVISVALGYKEGETPEVPIRRKDVFNYIT
jgi:nitroreductase